MAGFVLIRVSRDILNPEVQRELIPRPHENSVQTLRWMRVWPSEWRGDGMGLQAARADRGG